MEVVSNGTRIFYKTLGAGPALVLLHPFPANHEIWVPAAEHLAQHYRLILPDLRGHGASETGAGPATMQSHAEDVMRICEALRIPHAVFAGISIGGYILFEFWRRFRDCVTALILCNTRATADTPEARAARLKSAEDVEQFGPVAFLDGMLPKLIGESTRRDHPGLAARARGMMAKSSAQGIAAVQRGMAARADSTPSLKTINVPTLILGGSEDTLIPMSEVEAMHLQIAGSEFTLLPRAGHYAPYEVHQAAAHRMLEFLDNLRTS
jgi:pimeloyl-ACP methyl ester carboxylesterase